MKKHLLSEYNSLEEIMIYLKTKTDFDLSIEVDEWITNGSLMLTPGKKCLVIKKSATAGAKVNLVGLNTIEIHPIPPSRFVNNLVQKGVLAIIIYRLILGSQKEVVKEVENYLSTIQKP